VTLPSAVSTDQEALTVSVGISTPLNAKTEIERAGAPHAQMSQLRESWVRFGDVLFGDEPRSLLGRLALAILLYVAAVLGREAIHLVMPGAVRYFTFFPALLAAGFLCGFFPSIALLAAFAITGFFWIDEPDVAAIAVRLGLALAFLLSGFVVITTASYAVGARRRLKQHDERLALFNDELRHRIKNLFAVTSSICSQSLNATPGQKEISSDIIGRIQAIASAQDFLSMTSTEGSDFRGLIDAVIEPMCPSPVCVEVAGPAVKLPPDSTTSFALVLHELATNAVKYGSWRLNCEGKVLIEWRVTNDELWFHWRECGVEVSAPTRQGFGSKVIRRSLPGAKVEHLFHPDGVECTISMKI
jgi:two-component sensor histidine kinase